MRRRLIVSAALVALAVLAVVGTALSRGRAAQNPDEELDRAFERAFLVRTHAPDAVSSDIVLQQFTLLGHTDLGASGVDFADLWVNGNYAYVGTRCGSGGGGYGVKAVNISRPTAPSIVGTLATEPGTRAEDVVVKSVDTPSFKGALAAVGIQLCNGSSTATTGLKLYDVTQPAQPQLLATWALPPGSWGCHEVDLVQRADGRVLVACARNLNDQFTGGANPQPAPGAVKIVDATNPRAPVVAGSWEAPIQAHGGVGCNPLQFAHSARFAKAGTELYVSYWDAGTVRVDVTNPSQPAALNRILITPTDEDGENHSVGYANGNRWLVINPEDFSPQHAMNACAAWGGWGDAYVYDVESPGSPTFLARFNTVNGTSQRTDGIYTVHNTESIGKNLFSSWYSDGILWWTVDGPNTPRQIGQFVPPGFPQVWGVAVDPAHRAVLASDMNSGLWLVRPKQPGT